MSDVKKDLKMLRGIFSYPEIAVRLGSSVDSVRRWEKGSPMHKVFKEKLVQFVETVEKRMAKEKGE